MVYRKLVHTCGKLIALCVVVVATGASAPAADATSYEVQSVAPWKQNAAPMGWSASLDRVIYNSRGADGMFDAYSANPDGSDPQCLTCTIPSFAGVGAATQRGVSDVSSDGNFMLLEVERGDHGGQIGAEIDEPGKGASNDVWLARTDGSQAWPLTDITAPGQQALGTMWARFDPSGQRLVWAELYAPAIFNLGFWRLKVADIVWRNGVPSLANVQTIEPEPDHFYEPYGFSPDGSHILFASDLGMPSWWDSQIYSIATDGSGLTRLSPADAPTGFFTNYNEFAFYLPHGDGIMIGRTRDATGAGMDYWLMQPDGSQPQRLTFFNEAWNTEYLGYTVVGGLAFDPNDPNRFITGVSPDSNASQMNAMVITLSASAGPAGLTGHYYSDLSFGNLVQTRVENPSLGMMWDGSPAPGVPSSNYSVRWTGTVTAPASGNYTFCTIADSGIRLYLAGTLVIDGWWSFGHRECASVTEPGGAHIPIQVDYWHGSGTGYAQLSWIPPSGSGMLAALPSSSAGAPIPVDDLAPTAQSATPPIVSPPGPLGAGTTSSPVPRSNASPPAPRSNPSPPKPRATRKRRPPRHKPAPRRKPTGHHKPAPRRKPAARHKKATRQQRSRR